MEGRLSRDELIRLVQQIMEADATEAELDQMLNLLQNSVPDPNALNLIFWPGGPEPTAEEIVDKPLSYKPIALRISTVTYKPGR